MLDKRSFILGMVTAFSECVAAGCKQLALSPPLTGEDYASVAKEANEINEKNPDLPEEKRFEWILIARRQETIDRYLELRGSGCNPADSLVPFSELLSYKPDESVHTGYDAFRSYFG